ncbi:MAG TPA: hypothetical protein VF634_01605, partial [Pyrinomonadaceae bacterium]
WPRLKNPHAHLLPSAPHATKLDPSSLPDPLAPRMMDKAGAGQPFGCQRSCQPSAVSFQQETNSKALTCQSALLPFALAES